MVETLILLITLVNNNKVLTNDDTMPKTLYYNAALYIDTNFIREFKFLTQFAFLFTNFRKSFDQ